MFPYSAKKNIAKNIEEYSTLYPATISASASGRSNGVLLVSANIETRKIIKHGKNGRANQTYLCDTIISVKFMLPAAIITGTTLKDSGIS